MSKLNFTEEGLTRVVVNSASLVANPGLPEAADRAMLMACNQYPGVGGGWLYWDVNSTATVDNVNVFAASGRIDGRWIRIRESVPTTAVSPVSPLELLPKAKVYWSASANVSEVNSGIFASDVGNAVSSWSIGGLATPVRGARDPYGGATAWRIRQTATTEQHGFGCPGITGTVSSTESLVFEFTFRLVGAPWLYIYDVNDVSPIVNFHEANGSPVINISGNGTTARAQKLPNGFWKLTIVAAMGSWWTNSSLGPAVAIGNASGYSSVAGNTGVGIDLYSVVAYQYSRVAAIGSQGSITINELTGGTGAYTPQLVPESAALGMPGIWTDPIHNATLTTNDSVLCGYFNPGHAFTLVMTLYLEMLPSAPASYFNVRSDAHGFAFGINEQGRIWAGWYGDLTYSMGVPAYLSVGRVHTIALTYTGSTVSVWLNGACVLRDYPQVFSNLNANAITWGPLIDNVILGCAIWDTALPEAAAIGVSRYMSGIGDQTAPDVIEVQNAMLWNTARRRRCPMSDLKLALDGSARTVKVRACNAIAGNGVVTNGPAVFADGVFVGEMAAPAAKVPNTQTFVLPSGTRELVIRDGLSALWDGMLTEQVTVSGATVVMPTIPSQRMAVYGDSLSAGQTATHSSAEGWAALLRTSAASQYEVSVFGTGGNSLYLDNWDATARTRFVAEIVEHLNGTSHTDVFISAIGINDGTGFWSSWGNSAANFGTALADFLDKLHAASSGTRILLLAPPSLPLSPAAANIAAIGAQIMAIGAARSWCEELDLSTVSIEIDSNDATHLHPTTAGHLSLHNAVRAKLRALSWMQ